MDVGDERYRLLVEGVVDYGIFVLDTQGRIASWNAGARRIKGFEASDVLGRHFSMFYPPEAVASGWPEHELKVARQVGRFEDEGWRVRKDGTRFWANVVITALRADDGTLLGFSKITRDLTERRRHEESLRHSEERFRLLVEAVKDYAIFMLDTNGCVASWNAGAHEIKGYTADEIIGRHFSIFYPKEALARDWPEYELERAREDGRFRDEGWRLRKDGTAFWASVVITALRDRDGQLRGYAKVTRDMTERKQVEALEAASDRMTQFLAMLAHELRNPLAPIRNAVSVMRLHVASNERLSWCRDVVDRQITHLARLVDDLLDVSRITSGKITLHKEELEITAILDRALEASAPLMQARRHRVKVRLPGEPVVIEGDITRLAQVFLNLLNNAAKYTPENGDITVTVTPGEHTAEIVVSDTGIGIAPELAPRVFELFVQGERGLDRAEGGLGIGLTLVREIVSMHGGTVEANSAGPGKGTSFTVRLPLMSTPGAGAPADDPHKPAVAAPRRRLLVVDDNQDSAESMAILLGAHGHEIHVAYDGPSALKKALEVRPQLILLDIGLPEMDGYEVVKKMRAEPAVAGAVIAAMTGYGQDEDRVLSREAGFDHHLVKPVPMELVEELIDSLPPAE